MEVFVQNSPIYCIFRLPSVTDRFNPNIQFPDQICYSDTLVLCCVSVVDVAASVSIIVILMTLYCNVSDSSVRP